MGSGKFMAHKPAFLAIVNQKGGVAKTTTGFGHNLALEGKRTLSIDFDPQGNLIGFLGLRQEPCMYDWLTYPVYTLWCREKYESGAQAPMDQNFQPRKPVCVSRR